jgi:hypothetical protein
MNASFNTTLVFKAKPAGQSVKTFTCTPAQMATFQAEIGTQTPSGSTLNLGLEGYCSIGSAGGLAWIRITTLGTSSWPLAQKTGSVFSLLGVNGANGQIFSSIGSYTMGGWVMPNYTVAWTNGTSLANPSKATFNDTQFGVTSDGTPITLTGTVYFTRGGNLVTLN